MKRAIIIPRPAGEIPGLLQINSYLVKHHGFVVTAILDKGVWVGMELRPATVENDTILTANKVLVRHQLEPTPSYELPLRPIEDVRKYLHVEEREELAKLRLDDIYGFTLHLHLTGAVCTNCGQNPGEHRQSDSACPRRAIARRLQNELKGTPS